MRDRPETVVYVATSIDGYIARPDGGLDWLPAPDEEAMEPWQTFMASVDHLVMGRKTFEQVLAFGVWPYEGTPVTVLSTSLKRVPETLSDKADVRALEPVPLLDHLDELGRGRVYVDGGQVVQGFLRADLIDEMILTTIPVLLGSGIRLFGAHDGDLGWELIATTRTHGGLAQAHYRRSR